MKKGVFTIAGGFLLSSLSGCFLTDGGLFGLSGGGPSIPPCGELEVNVISTYGDSANSGRDKVTVHVKRTAPQILVLNGFDPIEWDVKAVNDAQIEKIVVTGYFTPTVKAPAGVPVEILPGVPDGGSLAFGCAYEYPDLNINEYDCETDVHLAAIEHYTGYPVTSFHTSYHLTQATLHNDLSVTTDDSLEGYSLSGFIDEDCSDNQSTARDCDDYSCGAPNVSVLSVYEAAENQPVPNSILSRGTIQFHIAGEGPQIVVLNSYSVVDWVLTVDPAAQIEKIVVSSPRQGSVIGAPAGVPIEYVFGFTPQGGVADFGCAYEYPPASYHGMCSPSIVIDRVEEYLGKKVTSFSASYWLRQATQHPSLYVTTTDPNDDVLLTGFVDLSCIEDHSVCLVCGDGVVDYAESCEDGNFENGDGCNSLCILEYCGDGLVNTPSEQCDDGNFEGGDGCASCLLESNDK